MTDDAREKASCPVLRKARSSNVKSHMSSVKITLTAHGQQRSLCIDNERRLARHTSLVVCCGE